MLLGALVLGGVKRWGEGREREGRGEVRKGVQGVTKEGKKLQNENENVTQVWGAKVLKCLKKKRKNSINVILL